MAKKFDCDVELDKLNEALKIARTGVSVKRIGQRLYLRATLPAKPDSKRVKVSSQRIRLAVFANPAGLKTAKKKAFELSNDIASQSFRWEDWVDGKGSTRNVAGWIDAFEVDYFIRRKRNPKSETTWEKDYRSPFNRLPKNQELTANLLISTAESYPADTRSRKRACDAYNALARFANVDVNLKPLRGKYRPNAVNREDVPSDELILEWCDRIPDPKWLNFYRLVACYGLRNHEAFHVDLEKLKIAPIAVVTGGKTGYRAVALPCPLGWWESWFEGKEISLPLVNARNNSHYGNISSHYFRRLELPFKIYDLRHAHAGRMAIKGIDPAIAARSQGHSLKVHSEIYLNFLGAEQLRGVLDDLR